MTAARPDTWMPLYWGDYLRDTADLTAKEHGAYLLLIGWYWTNGGAFEDDRQGLARVARLDDANDPTLPKILERFFRLSRGKWRQKRAEFELKKAVGLVRNRKKAGKAGGLASGRARSKGEANVQANGQAKRTPSPSPPQDSSEAKASSEGSRAKPQRGTRIPPDWLPSEGDREVARQEGFNEQEIDREADRFRDYWTSRSDKGAVKRNWSATWRNWCRKEADDRRRIRSGNGRREPTSIVETVARAVGIDPTEDDVPERSPELFGH